jgi:hypothetical protein
MSTTLTIPAETVLDVREALFSLMGDATEQIDQTLIRPGREVHPEWYQSGRSQLERVFALLDLVGWATEDEPHEVELDPREHGKTLTEAAERYLPFLADQEREADVNDQRRAELGERPRKDEIVRRAAAFREFAAMVA